MKVGKGLFVAQNRLDRAVTGTVVIQVRSFEWSKWVSHNRPLFRG